MYQLTDTKIQELIKNYINELLENDLEDRINREPLEPDYDPYGRDTNTMVELMLSGELKGKALDQLKRSDYSEIRHHVDSMLTESGTTLSEVDESTYKKLCHYSHLLKSKWARPGDS